jgi:hypothetical protein
MMMGSDTTGMWSIAVCDVDVECGMQVVRKTGGC